MPASTASYKVSYVLTARWILTLWIVWDNSNNSINNIAHLWVAEKISQKSRRHIQRRKRQQLCSHNCWSMAFKWNHAQWHAMWHLLVLSTVPYIICDTNNQLGTRAWKSMMRYLMPSFTQKHLHKQTKFKICIINSWADLGHCETARTKVLKTYETQIVVIVHTLEHTVCGICRRIEENHKYRDKVFQSPKSTEAREHNIPETLAHYEYTP